MNDAKRENIWEDRSPRINEIVLFRQRKRLKMGIVQELHERRPALSGVERIKGETEDRKPFQILADRIVYATGIKADEGRSSLSAFHRSASELSEKIVLEEVWEIAKDAPEGLTFEDIAELYWEEVTPLRCAALLLHLHAECPYFQLKENTYIPASEEDVRLHLERLQQRAIQQEEEAHFLEWLITDQPPDVLPDGQKRWFEMIREYALWGEDTQVSRQVRGFLQRTGMAPQQRAFDILVKKHIWDEDESLELLRSQIPVTFSEAALREAEQIRVDDVLTASHRTDLTELHVFSIDDETTTDVDDACSIERTPSGWRLGVHITDVASLVPADSALNAAAQERMASLYLPDRKIPMFPPQLSEHLGSLIPDAPRLALSVLFDLDETLEVRDTHISPSVIVNHDRLSYDRVDAILDGASHPLSESLRILDRIAEHLRSKRIAAGAVVFEQPEIQIRVDEDKRITLRKRSRETRSNRIVTETMILVNRYAAALCAEHALSVGYRTQEPVALDDLDDIPHEAVRRHQILRRVKSSSLSLEPGPHHLLGVDRYTQVTSPLRRYTDLLVQRQIVHYLTQGEVVYDRDEMAPMLYRADEQLRELSRLERSRERYWLLKYLEQFLGEEFSAVVLHMRGKRALIELTEYALQTSVYLNEETEPGNTIRLRLTGVNPRMDEIHFLQLG